MALADNVDKDQTAQNVQSDLGSGLCLHGCLHDFHIVSQGHTNIII